MEIKKFQPKKKQGLVVVITGNGKGKTTSALGIALRATGYQMKVCIIQFMKGDLYSGEWDSVKRLDGLVELISTGKGFCCIEGSQVPYSEHRQSAQEAVALVMEKMDSNQFDILILDEINNALKLKLIDLDQVMEILRKRPLAMHLILTGRSAHPDVVHMADTVSEVMEIKHAFRKGIEPQPGIDY